MNSTQPLSPTAAPALPASYASQLLTQIADQLDAGHPARTLTPRVLGDAVTEAMRLVLNGLPQVVRDAALAAAMAAGAATLRDHETAGERALILRTAARNA